MSISVNAFDHRKWAAYGLKDYGDFAECVSECNQDDFQDHTTGEWFYIPDEPLTNDEGTFRVIYYGTWGNYNSPGASSYTNAELFDVSEQHEMDDFGIAQREWEAKPEWIEHEATVHDEPQGSCPICLTPDDEEKNERSGEEGGKERVTCRECSREWIQPIKDGDETDDFEEAEGS